MKISMLVYHYDPELIMKLEVNLQVENRIRSKAVLESKRQRQAEAEPGQAQQHQGIWPILVFQSVVAVKSYCLISRNR